MKFQAHDVWIKQTKADKGWSVTFDCSQDQFEAIRDLPNLQERMLEITITELEKNE